VSTLATTPARAAQEHHVTLREVFAIALPIMLSGATVPLVGFVDTLVVGQLGAAALIGGMAVSTTMFNAIYWAFGFLRMGTTGFTAQAVGAGDMAERTAIFGRGLLVASAFGLALVALQVPIKQGFFAVIGGSPDVQAAATAYYDWRIWAAPAGLINYVLMGWFMGLGRAMIAFWLQLLVNVINIALSLALVIGLQWGVAGAGLAAFVSEAGAAVVGLLIAWRMVQAAGAPFNWPQIIDLGALRRMVAVNRDIFIRTLCLLGVTVMFTSRGAAAGDVTLAANAVLMSLLHISIYLLDGYESAAQTLVGQAVGARNAARLTSAVRVTMQAAAVTGVILGLVLWLAGPLLVDLMTVSPDVRAQAREYLLWLAVTPFIAVWCFQLDGIFIGATRTVDMRNMMLISFAVYLVALAILFPRIGNHGVWTALNIFFVARAITLGWCYPALVRSVAASRSAG
jgi:multidrug resistance protein, MATE family